MLLASILLAFSLLCNGDQIYKAEFDNFISEYGRKYDDAAEYEQRLQIFSKNLEIAQKLDTEDPYAQCVSFAVH
jgi:hypothetical protein